MKVVDQFAIVREIPFPQVAAYYGLHEQSNHMCCCPFHTDNHPSMKIYGDHAYCFSCGTYLDNIGLVQKLYGCTAVEALNQIKSDFGLSTAIAPTKQMLEQRQAYLKEQQYKQEKDFVIREILKYYRLLQNWKQEYSPKNTGGTPTKAFVYAINNEAYTAYILDALLTSLNQQEEKTIVSQIITSKWFENIKKINKI